MNRNGRYKVRKVGNAEGANVTTSSDDCIKPWAFAVETDDIDSELEEGEEEGTSETEETSGGPNVN